MYFQSTSYISHLVVKQLLFGIEIPRIMLVFCKKEIGKKNTIYSNYNNNNKADFPQYSHSLIILIFYEYRYYNTSLLLHSQFFFLSLFTFYLSSDHLQSKYAHPKVCSANPHYLSVLQCHMRNLCFDKLSFVICLIILQNLIKLTKD